MDSKCTCIVQLGSSRVRNELALQKYSALICRSWFSSFFCRQLAGEMYHVGMFSVDLIYFGKSERMRVKPSRWTIPFGALI
jgi:hypothetical protein